LYRIFFRLYLLLILINSVYAQNYVYNGVQFYNETKEYFKAPINWQAKDFIILSSVAASTYLLMQTDENLNNYVVKSGNENKTIIYETARVFGEPYFSPIIGTILLINGSVTDNNSNKRLGFEILQSIFYSGVTSGFVKICFGRSRPYQSLGNSDFHPFSSFDDSKLSLPSGHTTLSFALFTTLSLNSKNDVMKVIYFVPALFTAASRVAQNKHWLSDVFLGATIGYFTARFVHSLHDFPQLEQTAIPQQSDLISFSVPLF